MQYLIFVINFCINWLLIFIIVASGLQYLHATWTTVAVVTTVILVGSILFFLTPYGSGLLRISIPHRELNAREIQYLKPLLKNLSQKTGKKPLVFMQDNRQSNAMVVGNAIIITTGLLHVAVREEMEAVLAHEFGHIKNEDVKLSTLNYATSKMSDVMLIAGMGLVSLLSFNGRIGILYLPYFIIACVLRFIRWILLNILNISIMAATADASLKPISMLFL